MTTQLNLNIEEFLTQYWQKQPTVIRGGFADPYWLEPDDLAGLACEEGVESRILMQQNGRWTVESGPFPEERFAQLPDTDWTLLVQAVDQWIPDVQQILESFRFLPSWRIDDIMVSFAPEGGTVSQHYDYYDVFLIQGEGRRRWQLGQMCDSSSELIEDCSVKILKDFEVASEFVLEPGDILYIPAGVAHYGVSEASSLTYSVGFRSPCIREIVDGVATAALESLSEDLRYRDSDRSLEAARGEIPEAAIDTLNEMLQSALMDRELIRDWFGRHVTEKKYPELEYELDDVTAADCSARLKSEPVFKSPASRFAYFGGALFVDGEAYELAPELARQLADSSAQEPLDLRDYATDPAMVEMCQNGALQFEA